MDGINLLLEMGKGLFVTIVVSIILISIVDALHSYIKIHFYAGRKPKQTKKCPCPVCGEDLCSNGSYAGTVLALLKDHDEYVCSKCECMSHWSCEVVPVLLYYLPLGKEFLVYADEQIAK
jgi:hypothetical protein